MKVLTGFADIVGQPVAKEVLTHWVHTGNTPHALLFTGPSGAGKKTAGLLLAKALLCKNSILPCNQCPSCKKIEGLAHPDLWVLSVSDTSKKGEITIDQIRENILDGLYYRPFEGNRRVILIPEAHKMNIAASNALLKALEEPPSGTYFILTAPSASNVISTIRSRCQKLRFIPLTETALSILFGHSCSKNMHTSAKALSILLHQGHASDSSMEEIDDLRLRILFLARQLAQLPDMPTSQKLALAEYLGKDRENALIDLDILLELCRDMAFLSVNPAPENEIYKILQPLRNISAANAFHAADLITQTKRQIMGNTTPRLCLEKLFLVLSDTFAVS